MYCHGGRALKQPSRQSQLDEVLFLLGQQLGGSRVALGQNVVVLLHHDGAHLHGARHLLKVAVHEGHADFAVAARPADALDVVWRRELFAVVRLLLLEHGPLDHLFAQQVLLLLVLVARRRVLVLFWRLGVVVAVDAVSVHVAALGAHALQLSLLATALGDLHPGAIMWGPQRRLVLTRRGGGRGVWETLQDDKLAAHHNKDANAASSATPRPFLLFLVVVGHASSTARALLLL